MKRDNRDMIIIVIEIQRKGVKKKESGKKLTEVACSTWGGRKIGKLEQLGTIELRDFIVGMTYKKNTQKGDWYNNF